ncbi:hypothetical protein AA313_de0201852 [Arthrobotrys entomopaga]|nr:hypothetical protein AA313_de0201852 [Arthrobotrys entomopaga]
MVNILPSIPTILYLTATFTTPSRALFEMGFRRYLFSGEPYPPLDTYSRPYICNTINQPPNPTNFIKWIVMRFTTSRGYGSNPVLDTPPQAIAFYRSQAPTRAGPHCIFPHAEAIAHYYPSSHTMQWFKTRRSSLTHFRVLEEDNSREWNAMMEEGLKEGGVMYRSYTSGGWNKSPVAINVQDEDYNFGFEGSSGDDSWRDENDSEENFPTSPDSEGWDYEEGEEGEEDDDGGVGGDQGYSSDDGADADTEVNTEASGWAFLDTVGSGLRDVDPWDRFSIMSEIVEASEEEEEEEEDPDDSEEWGEIISWKPPVEDDLPPQRQYNNYNTEIEDVDRNLIRLRNKLIESGQYVPVPSVYRHQSLGELRWMGFNIYPKEEIDGVRLEWLAQAFYDWKMLNGLDGNLRWTQLTPTQRDSLTAFLAVQPKWTADPYIVELVREHNRLATTTAAQNQVTNWGQSNPWSSDFLVKQEDENEPEFGVKQEGDGGIQTKIEGEDIQGEKLDIQVKLEDEELL